MALCMWLFAGNHDYVPDNQLPAEINDIYTNISMLWDSLGWFTGQIGDGQQTFSKSKIHFIFYYKCTWINESFELLLGGN